MLAKKAVESRLRSLEGDNERLPQEELETARGWLRAAASVAVLTGAGVSAESGVPTFRGAGGLWGRFRAEDLATPEAFERDPKLVWEWYEWRRRNLAAIRPNAGHFALAKLERSRPAVALITQNVDGLHALAGSRNLICVHGDIWLVRCTLCGRELEDRRLQLPELPPRCMECGGLMRPGVVWFGESLPREAWRRAEAAARACEVFLVAGTSAQVYPAAGLIELAAGSGARVIEVNLEETPFSETVDFSLRGKCGEILPQLVA